MLRFTKYLSNEKLQSYIQYYFVIDFGVLSDKTKHNTDFLTNHPQGTFDLMFALKGGIELQNFRDETFALEDVFMVTQQEGYFQVRFKPDSLLIGVVFYPEAFRKLFNFPLDEATNKGILFESGLGDDYLDVLNRLRDTFTEKTFSKILDVFFEQRLSKVDYSYNYMDKLIKHIRENNGLITIDKLAFEANMTTRTLQRQVKKSLGVSPKSFSNVMRMKYVLHLINNSSEHHWQDILYQNGYYDQSHFIKDFKRYTGKTPLQFLRESTSLSRYFI